MTNFNFTTEHISIVDAEDQKVNLSPQEALNLLQWLFDKRGALLSLTHQDADQASYSEKRLEIFLSQEHLDQLDTLKAAIPHLQEYPSAAKVLTAPFDSVTERAIQLLKELQVEYRIHPLLEDNTAFAQG
ncbi:MAG TPA: hypothetical protein DCL75_09065 [Ktedonobacter sp.]|jgi:hypothetical protein|nr:hypothetical protein [Ktedonobacter sp.]HAT46555.1 hypothetical protein [Ktedonobacter sp.]HCP73842.1 hypothetical protein [Ktedonobacter sp.]